MSLKVGEIQSTLIQEVVCSSSHARHYHLILVRQQLYTCITDTFKC